MKIINLYFLILLIIYFQILSCENEKEKQTEVAELPEEAEPLDFFSELAMGDYEKEKVFFNHGSPDSILWSLIISKSTQIDSTTFDTTESFLKSRIPNPRIDKILRKEILFKGRKIEETFLASKNPEIAKPGCKNGIPVIYYFSNAKKDPVSFAFIRFHEYAHIALDHSPCPDNIQRQRKFEYQADSMAIAMLLEFDDGLRVVDRMAGFFYAVDSKGGIQVPGSRERAEKFYSLSIHFDSLFANRSEKTAEDFNSINK